MKLKVIKSSNLRAVGYDPDTRTLGIEFRNGARWDYDGVPEQMFQEMTAGTITAGSYFARNIRGKYPGRRIVRKKAAKK